MSITLDHLILARGTQLTDEELEQLAEIVTTQKKERSPLNNDIDLDKGKGQYTVSYYPAGVSRYSYGKRIRLDLAVDQVADALWGDPIAGVPEESYPELNCSNKEPRQYKFMRLSSNRYDAVIAKMHALKATINKSNVIDLPMACRILVGLEEEVDALRTTYEDAAKQLINKFNKKAGISNVNNV